MRYFLVLILSFVFNFVSAQSEVTTSAAPETKSEAPAEPVTENKDAAKKTTAKKKSSSSDGVHRVDPVYRGTRTRVKARGYRVQVYSGAGNSVSKQAAQEMAAKVREKFPEISVYCRFVSPRWVCRIGDFATKVAAQKYLAKVKNARLSQEASIVICDVLLAK